MDNELLREIKISGVWLLLPANVTRASKTAPPPNLQRKNDRLLFTMNKNCNPRLPGQSQLHLFFQKNIPFMLTSAQFRN